MEDIFTGVGGLQKTQEDFINGGADIFTDTPMEKATKYCTESIYRPATENPAGPFEFYLPAEADTYIDPQGFRLSGYTQIKKVDPNTGSLIDLIGEDKVAPINFVAGMAFQTKELSINGVLVNYATQPLDNYKAYWENLLSYGSDAKNTILRYASNWIPDTVGYMEGYEFQEDVHYSPKNEAVSPNIKEISAKKAKGNEGFDIRRRMWAKSKKVGFSIPLQIDVLTTDRFFPKNMDLHLKLTKAPDAFLYNSAVGHEYRVLLTDLKLHCTRITMTPELVLDHERRFANKQNAVFPYTRTDIKFVNISTGSSIARTHNIYRDKIPNSAIVFFVESAALSGTAKLNPLNFQNFGIQKFFCLRNSQEIPYGGYVQDYDKNDFVETYRRVFDEIGIRTNNIGNDITPEMYKDGCNFYPFDFSPDKCNGYHDHIALAGTLDFGVVFKEPTTKLISMVIMSQYDDKLILDQFRNVANRGEPTAI